MLGLGETTEELIETLADLRAVGCDLLTLGQYLQPSPRHLPVERYLPPDEFDELGRLARALGLRRRRQRPVRPVELPRRRDGPVHHVGQLSLFELPLPPGEGARRAGEGRHRRWEPSPSHRHEEMHKIQKI